MDLFMKVTVTFPENIFSSLTVLQLRQIVFVLSLLLVDPLKRNPLFLILKKVLNSLACVFPRCRGYKNLNIRVDLFQCRRHLSSALSQTITYNNARSPIDLIYPYTAFISFPTNLILKVSLILMNKLFMSNYTHCSKEKKCVSTPGIQTTQHSPWQLSFEHQNSWFYFCLNRSHPEFHKEVFLVLCYVVYLWTTLLTIAHSSLVTFYLQETAKFSAKFSCSKLFFVSKIKSLKTSFLI